MADLYLYVMTPRVKQSQVKIWLTLEWWFQYNIQLNTTWQVQNPREETLYPKYNPNISRNLQAQSGMYIITFKEAESNFHKLKHREFQSQFAGGQAERVLQSTGYVYCGLIATYMTFLLQRTECVSSQNSYI